MYPCVAVPNAVTVLYIFAVINLTALLNITLVEASVHVLDEKNRTLWKEPAAQADFGPGIRDEGIQGYLLETNPLDACSSVEKQQHRKIALIQRNDCNFDRKVFNAQQAGYVAVIIHDLYDDNLITMHGNGTGIIIPSVFIGYQSAQIIRRFLNMSANYTVIIYPQDNNVNLLPFLVPLTAVLALTFLTMIIVLVVRWYQGYRAQRRSRLSKAKLKKLPVKKFKKGDPFDVCAICLEDYEEGDKLRILPCLHGYHQKCIDPWLTKNRKLCPICKRKVVKNDSDSDSEEAGSGQTSEAANERSPLVNTTIQTSDNSSSSNQQQQTLQAVAQQLHGGLLTCSDSSAPLRAEGRHLSSLPAFPHSPPTLCESSVEVHEPWAADSRPAIVDLDSDYEADEDGQTAAAAPSSHVTNTPLLSDADRNNSSSEWLGAVGGTSSRERSALVECDDANAIVVPDDTKQLLPAASDDDEEQRHMTPSATVKDKKQSKRRKKKRDNTHEIV